MKMRYFWLVFPTAFLLSLGNAIPVVSQAIAVTSSKIELTGSSGGDKKDASCAGYIAGAPNHTLEVPTDANLTFSLKAAGQPALLIRSDTGKEFCVAADAFSKGEIRVPGRWKKGVYKVFVGDRAHGSFPYTLVVSPN